MLNYFFIFYCLSLCKEFVVFEKNVDPSSIIVARLAIELVTLVIAVGGMFPEVFVIAKLPSGLLSVNLNPSAEPSLWIVNKLIPFLSATCRTPAETGTP